MIKGVHIEVILASGYALLLVGIAVILEFVARHSHRRSEHFRNSGFTYKAHMDVWECPQGHHLAREQTDFERKIAHYRASAHKCNGCPIKGNCTDSHDGRRLESQRQLAAFGAGRVRPRLPGAVGGHAGGHVLRLCAIGVRHRDDEHRRQHPEIVTRAPWSATRSWADRQGIHRTTFKAVTATETASAAIASAKRPLPDPQ